MKEILMSIQPKWCELIASGKKTIEVRKTKPKMETPFKVYIYCTQATPYNPVLPMKYEKKDGNIYIGGKHYAEFLTAKVIGEFVCDDIDTIAAYKGILYCINNSQPNKLKQMCLSFEEVKAYLGEKNVGYNWHITDLVIYNQPK